MYVEILDGRYAGQMRDMEPGVAQDLINLGRARAFARPTAATPPLPGGYSGAPATKVAAAPAIVARVDEPTDKPYVAWDLDHKEPTVIVVPTHKAKKGK
jgi:hypothetical protein